MRRLPRLGMSDLDQSPISNQKFDKVKASILECYLVGMNRQLPLISLILVVPSSAPSGAVFLPGLLMLRNDELIGNTDLEFGPCI